MALPLKITHGNAHYVDIKYECHDYMNLNVITNDSNYVHGYQFVLGHYQYHTGFLAAAWYAILGIPWYVPTVEITDQKINDLTITLSGANFSTIEMKLIGTDASQGPTFHPERFYAFQNTVLDCKLNQDPEYLFASGYLPLPQKNGGAAKLTVSVHGATQYSGRTSLLFGLFSKRWWSEWRTFSYTKTVEATAEPIME
jgi:hypothetical protein